jgi:hypothetical protein
MFCKVVVLSMLEHTIIFQFTSIVIICINMMDCGVARTGFSCAHFLE